MNSSVTLSVSIDCPPQAVAAFVTDPRNLPQWAAGLCKSVRRDGDKWKVDTGEGEVGLQFTGPAEHGILDHLVTVAPDLQVFVPMRVVPNEAGSEVLFTLFCLPAMTEQRLQQDMAMVRADLRRLKQVMETAGPAANL